MMHDTRFYKRPGFLLLIFASLLATVFMISMASGDISLSLGQLIRTLAGNGSSTEKLILFEFRLPRIFVTILAGMGLAVSGAILQSITRNALADPGILGINSGAGLMVVIYSTFFSIDSNVFIYVLPLFALVGGFLTAILIYVLSYKRNIGINSERLVLVGVGMATAVTGAILTLTIRIDRDQYDFIANWMAGRIWGADWTFVLSLFPWIVVFISIALLKSNVLNMLNLHDQVAVGLGVPVEKERRILIFIAASLASVSVAVSGGIAFIGLMAPHIARSLAGPRHQDFLPVSAVLGSILLLISDTIGRVLLDPSGIPAGIIVTIIGAPYFIYLMAKK
jgi:iron complex transport system permease protein